MSFPKKGKLFPGGNGSGNGGAPQQMSSFAAEIAAALQRSLGPTRAGVKLVASWTGANEKTVKNWFSGRYGPSGYHLITLARHSDEVLNVFLEMVGRRELSAAIKVAEVEQVIMELLIAVRRLAQDHKDG